MAGAKLDDRQCEGLTRILACFEHRAAVFLFAARNSSMDAFRANLNGLSPSPFSSPFPYLSRSHTLSLPHISLSLSLCSGRLCCYARRRGGYAWHTFRTRGITPTVDTSSSDGTRTFPVAPETQRPAIMSVNRDDATVPPNNAPLLPTYSITDNSPVHCLLSLPHRRSPSHSLFHPASQPRC